MKKFLLLWLALSLPAYSATYYVSTTGSNAHACSTTDSAGTNKLTITGGLGCLSPGDTLDVHTGTYAESFNGNIPTGTSEGARVTLRAHTAETVNIVPPAGSTFGFNFQNSQQYITIDGFHVDCSNCSAHTVKVFSGFVAPSTRHTANHINIINNELKGSSSTANDNPGVELTAYWMSGVPSIGYNLIQNNVIHRGSATTDFQHGIYASQSNNTIEGNEIYDYPGNAIQISTGYDDNPHDNIVRKNNLHNFGISGGRSRCVVINGSINNQIYNNLCHDITVSTTIGGIHLYHGDQTKVYNNTIYNVSAAGIWIDSSSNTVRNNIIASATGSNIYNGGASNTFSNNLCSKAGTNCIVAAPGMTNAAGGDFTLAVGSAAVDTGCHTGTCSNVATVTGALDYTGATRANTTTTGSEYDIGAYELVSPPNSLTLLAPNGGESWQIGTTQTITWTTVGAGSTVEITADLDGNGSYETTISASTSNDGSLDWVVAGSANANCKIKVKDTGAATNDVSDAVFALTAATVTGTITIVTPTASAIYGKGTSVIISWTSTDVNGNVTVELSRNNGNTWETVGTYAYNASDVVYTATTPSSSNCKIRITSVNDTNVTAISSAFRLGGRIM